MGLRTRANLEWLYRPFAIFARKDFEVELKVTRFSFFSFDDADSFFVLLYVFSVFEQF